jgi:hypothetical protein
MNGPGIPTVHSGEDVNVTTYAWRRLDLEGVTFVRLEQGDDAVRVEGHEICVEGAERWAARFVIELDGRWEHRSTVVEVTGPATRSPTRWSSGPATSRSVAGSRSWPPMSRRRG